MKTIKEILAECKGEEDFKPHMMYDPKTGKGYKANTYADHVKMDKMGYTHEKPEVKEAKSSSGYELYHRDFSGAMQHAYAHAKKKGFIVDKDDIDNKVAMGPKRPSSGKTNKYILDTNKKQKLHVQVANLDNKRYELNMYIESVQEEVDTGQYGARKKPKSSKKAQQSVFDKHRERMKKLRNMKDDVDMEEGSAQDRLRAKLKKGGLDEATVHVEGDFKNEGKKLTALMKKFGGKPAGETDKGALIDFSDNRKAQQFRDAVKKECKNMFAEGFEFDGEVEVELDEGAENYTMKKGPYTRKVDGKTADRMKRQGWKLVARESASDRARRDAMRAMGKRGKDSADIDIDATDDDRKAASKNVLMQIRKASDLPKGGEIEFEGGKKGKISQDDAKKVTKLFTMLKKPQDKAKFQKVISKDLKSIQGLLKRLGR